MNSATLVTPSLRVDFQRSGDRYQHQISYFIPDGTGGLLISQEGQPNDIWPFSPALQSLHLETLSGQRQAAMLVGMAGRSHWSMTVEADVEQNLLLFDIACRVQELPVWLGSSYESSNNDENVQSLDCLSIMIWHDDVPSTEILLKIDRLAGTVRIPAPRITGDFPQTIRWRYAVGLRPKTTQMASQ